MGERITGRMISTPLFPLIDDPGQWDDLTLTAGTILLEAEGESPEGQHAVGTVIRWRSECWKLTIRQVILGLEGQAYDDGKSFEAFSAWNDSYRPMAQARLSAASPTSREAAWKAAAIALWRLLPDPAPGALFYLNAEATLRIRGGTFPAWAADPSNRAKLNAAKIIAVINRHTFMAG